MFHGHRSESLNRRDTITRKNSKHLKSTEYKKQRNFSLKCPHELCAGYEPRVWAPGAVGPSLELGDQKESHKVPVFRRLLEEFRGLAGERLEVSEDGEVGGEKEEVYGGFYVR